MTPACAAIARTYARDRACCRSLVGNMPASVPWSVCPWVAALDQLSGAARHWTTLTSFEGRRSAQQELLAEGADALHAALQALLDVAHAGDGRLEFLHALVELGRGAVRVEQAAGQLLD